MGSRARILITDDDPGIRDVLKIILEKAGYETIIHSSGDQLLNGNFIPPDLFILDKQLSGVNGLDICRHLKSLEQSRCVPVIILSASTKLSDLAEGAGADAFLEKPFKMEDLLEKVRQLLTPGSAATVVPINKESNVSKTHLLK
jgi:DNA-binding response OmpR family regulator